MPQILCLLCCLRILNIQLYESYLRFGPFDVINGMTLNAGCEIIMVLKRMGSFNAWNCDHISVMISIGINNH